MALEERFAHALGECAVAEMEAHWRRETSIIAGGLLDLSLGCALDADEGVKVSLVGARLQWWFMSSPRGPSGLEVGDDFALKARFSPVQFMPHSTARPQCSRSCFGSRAAVNAPLAPLNP
jgi:hypothetical protein